MLLDQSLNFHPKLRFLALDHWWYWCFASILLTISALTSPITVSLLKKLNCILWRSASILGWIWRTTFVILFIAMFSLAHQYGVPGYVTGEISKFIFIIITAGWCIWKMPLASELWHEGFFNKTGPLLLGMFFIMLVTASISAVTSDKGPWLVLAICGVILLSSVMGWTTGIILMIAGFLSIFALGEQLDVVADRLQAWRNAFTANHDDMARLLWFQYEASLQSNGWGVGQTPWCGGVKFDRCQGLPLQLQSDYTFTALVGWWGPVGAWLTVIFFSGYVYLWLMHAARFSAVELQPVNIISAGGLKIALLTQLLFLSGLVMLVQMSITVSGNLGWLPLTGITWPLISYGKTSLWVTTFLIGTVSRRSNHA